jgi:hypothetical protein
MGEDKTRMRLWRVDKKRGNRIRTPDLDVKLLRADGVHLFRPLFAAWCTHFTPDQSVKAPDNLRALSTRPKPD